MKESFREFKSGVTEMCFLPRALDAHTRNIGAKGGRMPFDRSVETLSYVRALQSIHLFSPLPEGGKFHVFLTAYGQNDLPRIFSFSTYQTYQYSKALLVYIFFLSVDEGCMSLNYS